MPWQSARARIWTGRKIASAEPFRILVVDDNKNAADALTLFLQHDGYQVQAAYGGKEAILRAGSWLPHLIVLDISMPECNGFEAALRIRANPHTSEIAIIAFTALDESDVRRQLSDHEFDAYCQKGEPPTKLIALLNRLTEDGLS
ncbi:response regulator [Caballeronia sp. ATUFL_M2_KS44]|uniref:response regulator n=1 Tax=Caballeronia sp. ATUFL_M2_KS44 TaxID=2921767 RepID=UPI0020287CC2|nr:response regulator [Caballeronia sp. ATUFL_M2_KS44]